MFAWWSIEMIEKTTFFIELKSWKKKEIKKINCDESNILHANPTKKVIDISVKFQWITMKP